MDHFLHFYGSSKGVFFFDWNGWRDTEDIGEKKAYTDFD